MKSAEQNKKLLAMLEKFSVSKDEATEIASALVELGKYSPRLMDKEVAEVVDRVVEDFMEKKLPKIRPKERPTVREKLLKAAYEIALGVIASGFWELLVFVFHHVVLHAASAEEDWRAQDAARARLFKPTKQMAPELRETLLEAQADLSALRDIYMREIVDKTQLDPGLKSIANFVAKANQWDEKTMRVFFYEWLAEDIHAALVRLGATKSCQ